MLGRIVIAGLVVLLALVAVRDGWLLRRTGLLGSCSVYATAPNGVQWEICKAGSLDGPPDLSGQGCSVAASSGKFAYWTCPAPIVSAPTGV